MKRVLLPLMLVLTTGCPTEDGETGEPTRVDDILSLTGDAATGATVYASRCQSCHAADGTGGIGENLVEFSATHTDEEMVTVILDGQGSMPSAADLQDQAIADVIAHIHTL